MRKDTFYRCVKDDEKIIVAAKTTGYSDGDIGLHKEQGFWVATHIPTGTRLTPKHLRNKTAKTALTEAKRLISEKPDFDQYVQKYMDGDIYDAFQKSKYNQTVTGVF